MQSIAGSLEDVDAEKLIAHIAVLAQLALRAPDAFEQKSDVVTAFLVKQVLTSSAEPEDEPVSVSLGLSNS